MKLDSRNKAVFVSCTALVAGMVGMAYAAVPLYYLFCNATGYGGTPLRASAAPLETSDRPMTVRFDTNIDPALPWAFAPEQRSVTVKIGENKLVFFHAKNTSDHAIVGHAAFNVAPENAAPYFDKIQCFCFTEQRLEAGESVDMPVSFFVSPTILKDHRNDNLTEITLSYTFYPAANRNPPAKTAAVSVKGLGG
jgi:cytochrome c oxidase assembly protein subunit 11